MARGKRSGRNGSLGQDKIEAGRGVPETAETVEYEELPDGPPAAAVAQPEAGPGTDIGRIDAMAQPEETREPDAPAPVSELPPPKARGFVPGLIGGLIGGAVVALGGGWYAYEHGPIKPALSQLEATTATAQGASSGVTALGGKVEELDKTVDSEIAALKQAVQQGDTAGQQALEQARGAADQGLQQAESGIAAAGSRLGALEQADKDMAIKLDQAASTFRAAGEQVISRLEAVNAKLVEVEEHQPADVVDKKTVADIAAKQAGNEQGQQAVAAALARLEQLVTQSLDAGNKQAAALQTMVDAAQDRMNEIAQQQRDLLAMKEQLGDQTRTNEAQAAALGQATQQVEALRAEVQAKVEGARSELQQKIADTSTRLTTEGAARERSVGLSLAASSLEAALQNGQPFEATVRTLHQLSQGDQVVDGVAGTLEPMAAGGIPTVASLAQGLDAVEQGLAAEAPQASSDWLARTTENLNSLIDLHPADQESVPGQGAVRGSRQALLLQDLAGAAAALKPLADQGNEAAKAWIGSADQRITATQAVDTLRQHLKTMVARQG